MPTQWQIALTVVGLLGYGTAAAAAIRRLRGRGAPSSATVTTPLTVGLITVAAMLIAQIAEGGTLLAVGNAFDAAVLIAWLIAAEVLVLLWAGRLKGIETFLLPVAAIVQACSLLIFLRSGPSAPRYVHQWHIIGHGVVITLATACFVASGVAGVVYLNVHRAIRGHRQLSVLGRLPALESLERFGRWMVALGFPLLTFGILTGVCGIAHSPPALRAREFLMAGGTVGVWVLYGVAMVIIGLRPRLRGPRAAALASGAAGLTVLNVLVYLLMRSNA